jgi:hypothetical protein
MAQPLYYLPGVRQETFANVSLVRQMLAAHGLTETFADVGLSEMSWQELRGKGPDGKAGSILAYQTPDGQLPRNLGFIPDQQEWTPFGDGSKVWIGVDPSDPPTAEDLSRKRQYGGYAIELSGQPWLVPVVRRIDDSTELPRRLLWDATGNVIEPVKAEYVAYWEETGEVIQRLAIEEGQPSEIREMPIPRGLELCVRALSINYRFSRPEQCVIGPIDATNWQLVIAATIDLPKVDQILAVQKKTSCTQAIASSTPGQSVASPDTAPAVAS